MLKGQRNSNEDDEKQRQNLFGLLRTQVVEQLDMTRELTDDELYASIDEVLMMPQYRKQFSVRVLTQLRQALYDSFRRLDVLSEALDDPEVTEIMVNGYDQIYVEKQGELVRFPKAFSSQEKLEDVIQQIVAKVNRRVNEANPMADVRLMMPKKDAQYYMMLLTKQLKDENDNTKTKSIVTLPENIEGKKLTYKTVQTQPIRLMPALFLLLPFILYEIARQKRKEAFENRNKQLIADYPNFVFELGLMIQCGLNVRTAWNRLTAEYEETQHKCKGYQRYLFEEMLVTRNQIEAGVNEAAAYGAFGRRCRAHCYLKLGSSLEQNLRQGISGLEQQLDQELTQALEQRKNQAIQDGERMETKMLFPMFLLLGLVMAIVMIPAFMSM